MATTGAWRMARPISIVFTMQASGPTCMDPQHLSKKARYGKACLGRQRRQGSLELGGQIIQLRESWLSEYNVSKNTLEGNRGSCYVNLWLLDSQCPHTLRQLQGRDNRLAGFLGDGGRVWIEAAPEEGHGVDFQLNIPDSLAIWIPGAGARLPFKQWNLC